MTRIGRHDKKLKTTFQKFICLTSVTRAKLKEKMEFPALFPHYA